VGYSYKITRKKYSGDLHLEKIFSASGENPQKKYYITNFENVKQGRAGPPYTPPN
jgi:hypothetical protein